MSAIRQRGLLEHVQRVERAQRVSACQHVEQGQHFRQMRLPTRLAFLRGQCTSGIVEQGGRIGQAARVDIVRERLGFDDIRIARRRLLTAAHQIDPAETARAEPCDDRTVRIGEFERCHHRMRTAPLDARHHIADRVAAQIVDAAELHRHIGRVFDLGLIFRLPATRTADGNRCPSAPDAMRTHRRQRRIARVPRACPLRPARGRLVHRHAPSAPTGTPGRSSSRSRRCSRTASRRSWPVERADRSTPWAAACPIRR